MNVELGWRMGSIAPLATAQHFSLFIFNYSLPKGITFHFSLFTFHFPKGRSSLPAGTTFHFSLFTFNLNNGLRCDGRCSVLR